MKTKKNFFLKGHINLNFSLSICIFLFSASFLFAQTAIATPFSRGVNFTDYFQKGSAGQVSFSSRMKRDLENVKSLGCDVVRIPINLHFMTFGAPNYTIDPLLFSFLDQTINWAEELQIHVILDNHTFDPQVDTDPAVEAVLIKVWIQMAQHFKNRSQYVHYEILNEPHGIDLKVWAAIQGRVIQAIRQIDKKHYILVGGANWNSIDALFSLPQYKDDKLIYTFHFYDPHLFTHQGAGWGTPSLESLGGLPFPYKKSKMPLLPKDLKNTWVKHRFQQYKKEGTESWVKMRMGRAVKFQKERGVPVFCGEWGVYNKNSDPQDRIKWYLVVRKIMEENKVAWSIWDYRGAFGIFTKEGRELFGYDINIPLVKVLRLNAPSQKKFKMSPEKTGFVIYDDYLGEGILDGSYGTPGSVNYYSKDAPFRGKNLLYFNPRKRYDVVIMDFKPDKDLSQLVKEGYFLEFRIKGNISGKKIEMRFRNSVEKPEDLPWRMGLVLDNSIVQWDNKWHLIRIPLRDLRELGAWTGEWFDPKGEFDWKRIDVLAFVAEYPGVENGKICIDEVRITR